MNPPPDAQERGEHPDEEAGGYRKKDGGPEPRFRKVELKRESGEEDRQGAARRLAGGRLPPPGAQPFAEHGEADESEDEDIGQLQEEVEIALVAEDLHELHADEPARPSSADDEQPHLEVDVAEAGVGEGSRRGPGGDLGGVCGGGHGGRNADEDQERRHQEAASHAEQTREEADETPHPGDQKRVHGRPGHREIDPEPPEEAPRLGTPLVVSHPLEHGGSDLRVADAAGPLEPGSGSGSNAGRSPGGSRAIRDMTDRWPRRGCRGRGRLRGPFPRTPPHRPTEAPCAGSPPGRRGSGRRSSRRGPWRWGRRRRVPEGPCGCHGTRRTWARARHRPSRLGRENSPNTHPARPCGSGRRSRRHFSR